MFAQTPAEPRTDWQLASLKDSFVARDGEVLSLRHTRGDVRIEASDTDRVQVTALAQHHADDPRSPAIRIQPPDGNGSGHVLTIDFAALEIAEQDAWTKRRIDVGLLVPRGLEIEIETTDGVIEAKRLSARAQLISGDGDVSYKGTGDLEARSERGTVRALLRQTRADHTVALSSLTGDLICTFLGDARAHVTVDTRGPITTDYSIDIERKAGSPHKTGTARIGTGDGSTVALESHSGAIRLQGLIAPETADTHR